PHRPRMREDLLSQLELLSGRGQREKGARVAHREPTAAEILLDLDRELQQAETIGHTAPVLADALSQVLLSPRELCQQALVGFRLLHRIQVLSEQVLHERQFEALAVSGLPDDGRDLGEPGKLGRPPTTLPDDELVPVTQPSDYDRLEHSGLAKGCGE